jgi:hypothetical protein
MNIIIKETKINTLSELKNSLDKEILLKINNMKWFDMNGNPLNEDEYKFYNVFTNENCDLDYLIDNCDLNDFRRIDLMVEELEENGIDLFDTIDEIISDFYTYFSCNPNCYLESWDFTLFSCQTIINKKR